MEKLHVKSLCHVSRDFSEKAADLQAQWTLLCIRSQKERIQHD